MDYPNHRLLILQHAYSIVRLSKKDQAVELAFEHLASTFYDLSELTDLDQNKPQPPLSLEDLVALFSQNYLQAPSQLKAQPPFDVEKWPTLGNEALKWSQQTVLTVQHIEQFYALLKAKAEGLKSDPQKMDTPKPAQKPRKFRKRDDLPPPTTPDTDESDEDEDDKDYNPQPQQQTKNSHRSTRQLDSDKPQKDESNTDEASPKRKFPSDMLPAAQKGSLSLAEKKRRRLGKTEKQYLCTWPGCTMACYRATDLTKHMYIHTGEKPHKCTWAGCGASFTQKGHLSRHTRIHTGEKPYRCKWCPASFPVQHHLHRHIRMHPEFNENDQNLNTKISK